MPIGKDRLLIELDEDLDRLRKRWCLALSRSDRLRVLEIGRWIRDKLVEIERAERWIPLYVLRPKTVDRRKEVADNTVAGPIREFSFTMRIPLKEGRRHENKEGEVHESLD